jgi:hypothetical protein
MSKIILSASTAVQAAAVAALFEKAPPVLIEVRFPRMGTSSDWYLFEEEEQLDQLFERLASGVELHISSVWDVKNPKGEICLTK